MAAEPESSPTSTTPDEGVHQQPCRAAVPLAGRIRNGLGPGVGWPSPRTSLLAGCWLSLTTRSAIAYVSVPMRSPRPIQARKSRMALIDARTCSATGAGTLITSWALKPYSSSAPKASWATPRRSSCPGLFTRAASWCRRSPTHSRQSRPVVVGAGGLGTSESCPGGGRGLRVVLQAAALPGPGRMPGNGIRPAPPSGRGGGNTPSRRPSYGSSAMFRRPTRCWRCSSEPNLRSRTGLAQRSRVRPGGAAAMSASATTTAAQQRRPRPPRRRTRRAEVGHQQTSNHSEAGKWPSPAKRPSRWGAGR